MYIIQTKQGMKRFTDYLEALLYAVSFETWKLWYKDNNKPAILKAYSGDTN